MLARWVAVLRGLLRRRAIAREIDEELDFHLAQETERNIDRGVPPDEARRLAVLSLGGVLQTKEAVHDVRATWIDVAWRELWQGARTLWATPAYTVPAAIVLALGIGGTTAVFSVLDGVLLRPLPYPDAEALVRVWSRNDARQIAFLSVSPADFEDWRRRASAARAVGAYESPRVLALRDGGEPITVMSVTADLFPTLGVMPAVGRGLRSDDDSGGVAVISHDLWQRRFGGTTDAIGRSLDTGEHVWTVVGVMPPRFEVPIAPADAWVPLDTAAVIDERFAHTLRVVVRARAGVDAVASVARDLEAVAAQLAAERPAENHGWSVTVLPLFDVVVDPELRRSLWIVAGAVVFVLLMAAASAAALLLTRASGRQRELAVRTALGASRGSLVRLLLAESLVLGVVSGAAGLLLAAWGVALLQSAAAASLPRVEEISLSGRMFAFAATTTLVSALAVGLVPACRSTRHLHEALRTRGGASEPASARALHTIVVIEMASAVLLAVGAALLVQTVLNLQRRDLGFEARNLLAVEAVWPSPGENGTLIARTEDVLSSLAALPGVARVAAVSSPPFSGRNSGNTFEIEGRPVPEGQLPDADYRLVSPGYFEALGIPILEGRDFTGSEGASPGAVIVSETTARRFWPGDDPIGRRLKTGGSGWLAIVGVVGDARYAALNDPSDAVRPMLYLPHRQEPQAPMTIVLRTGTIPDASAADVRRTLRAEGLGVSRIASMEAMLRDASLPQRFTMSVVTVFAAAALTLAVVGLYGLLAFLIARRTREIGLRVALGAGSRDIVGMVAGGMLLVVSIGVGIGLAASRALSAALRSALFGVSPGDPITYLAVAAGALMVAIAAGAVPTLRALRVDPIRVIRAE